MNTIVVRQHLFTTKQAMNTIVVRQHLFITKQAMNTIVVRQRLFTHSSGAVWVSRWTSWAVRPNEPSGFRGRKELLNRASVLVTICP